MNNKVNDVAVSKEYGFVTFNRHLDAIGNVRLLMGHPVSVFQGYTFTPISLPFKFKTLIILRLSFRMELSRTMLNHTIIRTK